MSGLRDVIIHQYDELDVEAIHRTATQDVQLLLDRLPEVITVLEPPKGG